MWNAAESWITPRGGEQAWAADTIENKPADAHLLPLTESCATLWHKLQCVLCTVSHSKDTYLHADAHKWKTASSHIRACSCTHSNVHTSGKTAKPMKLSKPQFRGNKAIPQCAFPTRNDSISPLADCTYDTFSSYFVKQAHSALHSNTDDMHFLFNHNPNGIKDQPRNM